ncbi:MAG: hypothetical protein HRU15_11440, partial [Planctomycetes bacterium]|nr:hypothetical protein [Planctomycetota bacterium]
MADLEQTVQDVLGQTVNEDELGVQVADDSTTNANDGTNANNSELAETIDSEHVQEQGQTGAKSDTRPQIQGTLVSAKP